MEDRETQLQVVEAAPVERFDWRGFIADDFKDALFRSREVRKNLYELKDKGVQVLQEVLELPLTKDTLPSVLKAAQYVLDHSMVQFPELSHRTVEMEVHKTSSNTVNVNAAPVLSKSDVMDAILIASKADGHRGSRSIEAIDLPEAQEVGEKR